MRILSYVKGMDGCSYHRIFQPNAYSGHEVKVVNNLTADDLKWCDVLNYSRHCVYAPEFLDAKRRDLGFKIVVDTDDVWSVDSRHPLYEVWKNGELTRQVSAHLKNADVVTVTHERLIDLVPNDKVFVLPNRIPYGDGQFTFREQTALVNGPVRLLYASSPMNYQNVELIERAMKKLSGLNIELIIAAHQSGGKFSELIVHKLSAGGKIPYRTIPWANVENYMSCYEGDIMLLPSKDNHFNSMKSNLKLLEAACLKIPVAVSAADPYHGFPAVYCRGEKEWVSKLTDLITDVDYRRKCGQELSDFCIEHYNMKDIYHIYDQL